ncbi:MAG: acyl-ACP--UDP-N-acetylglucosamine O-acyltransferase [Candidatus Pacebacteria bacterium]|nr:acyl-ACP--UDP-N-acetylglucosamine O-acyltransferase [Candidatus Paceibacterota bacterium]
MIHPTAVIASGAVVGKDVEIGPYTIVGEHVEIGDGCRIGPHCTLTGHTSIGARTKIHSGAVVGDEPQDYHYKGEVSYTRIGTDCTIREYATIHRGSDAESETVIGDNVMIMGLAHVAHNCRIGNRVTVANLTLLAGHVDVEDSAFISGGVLVHQFTRIGTLAMLGGGSVVTQDIPPYCMHPRDAINGPNSVGLKRAGKTPEVRSAIREAIKLYFFSGLNRGDALDKIAAEFSGQPDVEHFVAFIRESSRGIAPGVARKATYDR